VAKSILITGAAGFIGGYTAVTFRQAGWRTIGIDRKPLGPSSHPANPIFEFFAECDITREEDVIEVINDQRPEACIHVAGPASVQASQEHPKDDYSAQTLPLISVLEAIRKADVTPRLLLVSSAAVYGNPELLPISEQAPVNPISPYGFHKHHQERLLDEYHSLYSLPVCKARVFSTYGPGLCHLAVWDITRRALLGDYSVKGTGLESRDYLYVTDLASALLCIVEKAAFEDETINVGSGEETPIIALAEIIHSYLGIDSKPQLQPADVAGNPGRWQADISRLSAMGFRKEIPLHEGINKTIEWIKAND